MENIFKSMNESIFKSVKGIAWYDKDGIMELDEIKYVRFILDDVGTRDNFNGHWVEIYNRNNGLISKKFLRFQYNMEFIHRDDDKYYHIWYHRNILEWYVSRPKDTKQYVKILMDYINRTK